MDDQEVPARQFDADDLEWDTSWIRPQEQDEALPLRVG